MAPIEMTKHLMELQSREENEKNSKNSSTCLVISRYTPIGIWWQREMETKAKLVPCWGRRDESWYNSLKPHFDLQENQKDGRNVGCNKHHNVHKETYHWWMTLKQSWFYLITIFIFPTFVLFDWHFFFHKKHFPTFGHIFLKIKEFFFSGGLWLYFPGNPFSLFLSRLSNLFHLSTNKKWTSIMFSNLKTKSIKHI